MFFTWAARARENRIRFVGDTGAIEWTGGELRLERAGAVERLDYSAELEKTAYHRWRSEEHTSELQSRRDLVCRLLLEKKKIQHDISKRGHQTLLTSKLTTSLPPMLIP